MPEMNEGWRKKERNRERRREKEGKREGWKDSRPRFYTTIAICVFQKM